jgi:hypothetical protein
MVNNERCLICSAPATDWHHWPLCRQRRSQTEVALLPTVPLCREHHVAAHWAKQDVIEKLIDLAPQWWKREGTWEQNREAYESWIGKRRFLDAVGR